MTKNDYAIQQLERALVEMNKVPNMYDGWNRLLNRMESTKAELEAQPWSYNPDPARYLQ